MHYDTGNPIIEIHTQQLSQILEYRSRIVVFHHNGNKSHVHNVKKPQELSSRFFKDVPRVHMDISLEPGLGTDLV